MTWSSKRRARKPGGWGDDPQGERETSTRFGATIATVSQIVPGGRLFAESDGEEQWSLDENGLEIKSFNGYARGTVDGVQQWRLDQYGLTLRAEEDADNILWKTPDDIEASRMYVYVEGGSPETVHYVHEVFNAGTGNDSIVEFSARGDNNHFSNFYLINSESTTTNRVVFANVDSADSGAVEVQFIHNTTDTPDTGFGTHFVFKGETTTTSSVDQARIAVEWETATHASRKALLSLSIFDTAERTGLKIKTNGSEALVGLYSASPVARASHIADPSGGATVDSEARTAINSILVALENIGIVKTS